jgi:hypothetical protein
MLVNEITVLITVLLTGLITVLTTVLVTVSPPNYPLEKQIKR